MPMSCRYLSIVEIVDAAYSDKTADRALRAVSRETRYLAESSFSSMLFKFELVSVPCRISSHIAVLVALNFLALRPRRLAG